jgi:2-aminoadipate transaminase
MALPALDPSQAPDNPAYQEIARQIRAAIDSGELEAGERLPPIRGLAEQLGLNRDTVALAYESLSADGLLESVVGRGTFVRGTEAAARTAPEFDVELAGPVEEVLALENARPRFPQTDGIVSLHSLVPDPASYPVDEFRRILNRVLADGSPDLFSYAVPQGHPGLRDVLAERFRAAGMGVDGDDIVLCHGASQGISLALRLFAESGDAVAVETPTYHNVLATLAALGLRVAPVPMRDDGPDLAVLERVLSRPDVKAFYTIPTFHNPMGTTTKLAHRRALLEIAARHGKPVLEDAFEMDLRFRGRRVPSLAALDEFGLVVQLTSFSKSLFPGVRIGALLARGRSVDGVVALKHATDLSDSLPLQAALEAFVAEGSYDRHLRGLRSELRRRCDALLEAVARQMPEGTRTTRPDGGYQIWLELPFDVDTRELAAEAARAGVLFAPGSQFLPDGGPSRCLRLTIAQAGVTEIQRGVEALARVVDLHRGTHTRRAVADSVNL